mmetsp:Transcript_96479/g.241967  ORF Transcript_96479/g.241967 Transcript_96479/m.241967 type:complete len:466 (-) Transcript_96479:231-1628(-)
MGQCITAPCQRSAVMNTDLLPHEDKLQADDAGLPQDSLPTTPSVETTVGTVSGQNNLTPSDAEDFDAGTALPDANGGLSAVAQPTSSDDRPPGEIEEQALSLLRALRVHEAAAVLQSAESDGPQSGNAVALRAALELQLQCLGSALDRLADHPGIETAGAAATSSTAATSLSSKTSNGTLDATPRDGVTESLFGTHIPLTPKAARESRSECGTPHSSKRDVVEVGFDLDDKGRRVEVVIEFFKDGSASIAWTASDLPVPLPLILCLVNEVDLLGDLVPFVLNATRLHDFPWNKADCLSRVVSKPPIPFIAGLEAIEQRFGFDLLDTPWQGLCLVVCGPEWERQPDGSSIWRGVRRPPPYQAGLKEVDVKTVVALGRPTGQSGELTTIFFSGKGDMKVPRSLLPNWLISNLIKMIGKLIYQKALDRVANFDSSEHGKRLRGSGSTFYAELHERIKQFIGNISDSSV